MINGRFIFIDNAGNTLAKGSCDIDNGMIVSGQGDVDFQEKYPGEQRAAEALFIITLSKTYTLSVGVPEVRWWHKFLRKKPETFDVTISYSKMAVGDTVSLFNVKLPEGKR